MPTARGLHAHVLDTLGQRIVDGDLATGAVVRPELVADEFGVSRSVVREALRVLQSLGLVEPRQRVDACGREDSRAYLEADVRFHRALLTGSGNAVFAHFAGTVEALLRTRTSESRDPITRWTREAALRHQAVGRAAVDGDADAAAAAATALLRVTRDEFITEAPAG